MAKLARVAQAGVTLAEVAHRSGQALLSTIFSCSPRKMACLDAAAQALLAQANGHVYSESCLPNIMRNLEALGDFLWQMPSQQDNRVLAIAVQQKDKVLVNFKMTEDQNRDYIIMASKKSTTAQHHTKLAWKEAAEAYENEECLWLV